EPFTLAGTPLASHLLITGQTGKGKSKLISSAAVQLLNIGRPFAIVDPHSELCDDILKTLLATGFFKDHRAFDRLWHITFSHEKAHIAFNVLKQPYPPHQIASNLLEAWKRAWSSL